MQWAVLVDSQRSIVATTAYTPPSVLGVACTTCSGAPSNLYLSPAGRDVIVITGLNFGARADFLDYVVYGPSGTGFAAADCNITTPHTAITCFSAPGSGGGHTWSVSVRGQLSAAAPLVVSSYTSPQLVAIVPAADVPAVTGASPRAVTLLCKNLPLQSRAYIVFLQVGNGPDTLGLPYLRTLPLDLPATAAAIAAATAPDGSVRIPVTLPSPTWASPALPLPASCNLYDSPWALPPGAGDPACGTPDVAGAQMSLQLLVLPVAALASLSGPVTVAATLAAGGTVSTLSAATTLAFAPPAISTIIVSAPVWLTNTSAPCAFLAPASGAQLSPAWSCSDNTVLQIMVSGVNFGGSAPGLRGTLRM
jgi:hypothetical protein